MLNVIGLVGPIASGKGTVAKILEEKNYKPYSLSDRIREEIKNRGEEITRSNLNMVSNELRETLGADILAKRTADIIEKDNDELVVIDAIRNPAEVNYLKQRFGAKIIGVNAAQEKRYEMFKNRGINTTEVNTWEEFKKLDDLELVQEGSHKQQVEECLKLADTTIGNNGTLEELKQKVKNIISASP